MSRSPSDDRKVFDVFKKLHEERQQMKDASGEKIEQKPNGGVTGTGTGVLNQKRTPGTSTASKEHWSPTLTLQLHLVDAEI